MSRPSHKVLLFGASGQIGEALTLCAAISARPAFELRSIPWSRIAADASGPNSEALRALIAEVTRPWIEFDIVFANGLTDPRAPSMELTRSNVLFPLSVIEATHRHAPMRYLTLGTVFEEFTEFASANSYVQSKRDLRSRILDQVSLIAERRVIHLRLHTVYGGRPKPYMFLGQMIDALDRGVEFCMSSGEQLREYHHVHDIAGAILALLGREWSVCPPTLDLHSGAPVHLGDLARAVFAACMQSQLLKVGAMPTPRGENRSHVFPRSDASLLPYFRDPILGVLEHISSHRAARPSKGTR